MVEYEERNWTDPAAGAVSGYVGRPTREMERKWDAISNGGFIRFSPSIHQSRGKAAKQC